MVENEIRTRIARVSVDCKDVQTNFELYQLSSHSATLNHIRYFIVLSSVKMKRNALKSWKFFIIFLLSPTVSKFLKRFERTKAVLWHSKSLDHFTVLSSAKMKRNAFLSWKYFIMSVIFCDFRIPHEIWKDWSCTVSITYNILQSRWMWKWKIRNCFKNWKLITMSAIPCGFRIPPKIW